VNSALIIFLWRRSRLVRCSIPQPCATACNPGQAYEAYSLPVALPRLVPTTGVGPSVREAGTLPTLVLENSATALTCSGVPARDPDRAVMEQVCRRAGKRGIVFDESFDISVNRRRSRLFPAMPPVRWAGATSRHAVACFGSCLRGNDGVWCVTAYQDLLLSLLRFCWTPDGRPPGYPRARHPCRHPGQPQHPAKAGGQGRTGATVRIPETTLDMP
jgi:hypothetical protein